MPNLKVRRNFMPQKIAQHVAIPTHPSPLENYGLSLTQLKFNIIRTCYNFVFLQLWEQTEN